MDVLLVHYVFRHQIHRHYVAKFCCAKNLLSIGQLEQLFALEQLIGEATQHPKVIVDNRLCPLRAVSVCIRSDPETLLKRLQFGIGGIDVSATILVGSRKHDVFPRIRCLTWLVAVGTAHAALRG